MRTVASFALVGILLSAGLGNAVAGDDASSPARAIEHYVAMSEALASDSTEGIGAHAREWKSMIEAHHGQVGGHASMSCCKGKSTPAMDETHARIVGSLGALVASAGDLGAARAAFKTLSADFVPMARAHHQRVDGDPAWAVVNCPMAAADWIQVDGAVANPFFGSKMLRCGKKVADLGVPADTDGPGHSARPSDGHAHGRH